MNIELYTYSTPNGHKASIMLEETRLPYRACVVDIEKGEQHDPNFLVLNPNGKIPVIVDHETGLTVFESGAILLYLAEKSGKFLPRTRAKHSRTLQWLFFQIGHIGPMRGQLWHFKVFAPEKILSAINRYEREVKRLFKVLDGQLATRNYLVDDYGIADIASWPWIHAHSELTLNLGACPNLKRWHDAIAGRSAVQRGLRVPAERESIKQRELDQSCIV